MEGRDSALQSAIMVDNVSFSYGERRALDDITFAVGEGELVGILGPNGGGKSTLFRILATLVVPDAGRVLMWGADIVGDRNRIRRRLGVVFQSPALDIKLTARENLVHHGRLYGLSGKLLRNLATAALDRFELTERADDLAETLSGGLRRRLELAKAMLPEPQALLMDEPTTGLDPLARDMFWRLVRRLKAETGTTILYTTHILEEAEASDRVAILDRGSLMAYDSPGQLCAQIPGQVVTVQGADPSALAEEISRHFDLAARFDSAGVRVIVEDGAQFALQAQHLLGDTIGSIRIARPTLFDVFRERTGHGFYNGDSSPESRQPTEDR